MVTVFLVALFTVEIVGGIFVLTVVCNDKEVPIFGFGWLIGAFTAATVYVLWYQTFPVMVTG